MNKKVFSIRDHKALIYNNPFFKTTHGEAERDFRTAINDPQAGNLNKYPEDYALYYLGDYDDVSGTFSSLEAPQKVADGVAMLQKRQTELTQ